MKIERLGWAVIALALTPGGFVGAGCARRRAAPTPVYSGVVRSATGVPGQPGKFRLRLRLRRVDGAPVSEVELPHLCNIEIADPRMLGGAPGPSYSARIVRQPGLASLDLAIMGQLSPPPGGPITLMVRFLETRPTPLWKRLLSSHSTAPYGEVTARFPLGTFTLPAASPPTPTAAKKKPGSRHGTALNVWE
jgi:hypothetical protein